jgi:hypothetical protein
MSLSSKLRDFRRTLKKKNKDAQAFDDDQLRAIARHMPRDAESIAKFLSNEQVDSFGEGVLEVTQAYTRRDQDMFEECILEMGAFVRGGLPGMECLDRVYTQILKHYRVADNMEEVFEALELFVNQKTGKLMLKYVKDEDPSQRMEH